MVYKMAQALVVIRVIFVIIVRRITFKKRDAPAVSMVVGVAATLGKATKAKHKKGVKSFIIIFIEPAWFVKDL